MTSLRSVWSTYVLVACLVAFVGALFGFLGLISLHAHLTSPFMAAFLALTALYCWSVDAKSGDPVALGTGSVVAAAAVFMAFGTILTVNHIRNFKKAGGDAAMAKLAAPMAKSDDLTPVDIGVDLKPPTIISKTDAEYDAASRQMGTRGPVLVYARIDTNGNAQDLLLARGDLRLKSAAFEAVRSWHFAPGTRGGNPVPFTVQLKVNFRDR